MTISYFIIDTFTKKPFKGNPTAIFYTTAPIQTHIAQMVAKELNLPVTGFINKTGPENEKHTIRYFTPITQIPACGHATLAAAAVLLETEKSEKANFTTSENINIATEIINGKIALAYPKYFTDNFTIERELLNNLDLLGYVEAGFCKELETLFIELEQANIVRNVKPDYHKLLSLDVSFKEVVIFAPSDSNDYDFVLRSFCPWIGIDEDPVTGSVHSVLAVKWQKKLQKDTLRAYQASERGGEVGLHVFDDKINISGDFVIVGRGELSI